VAFVGPNEGVEQVELASPRDALRNAGGHFVLPAPKLGRVQAFNHLDEGDIFVVDQNVSAARVDDFAALVLPGGVASPDQLRLSKDWVDEVVHVCTDGPNRVVSSRKPDGLEAFDAARLERSAARNVGRPPDRRGTGPLERRPGRGRG
jgi:protease I